MTAPARTVRIRGRILFLTEDPALLEAQLSGKELDCETTREGGMPALIGNISTDEITPGWVCYYYDETLARFCLVGLRGGKIQKDAIKNGGFGVIVSGISKGCGSSRETAPYSELKAGRQPGIAEGHGKICPPDAPKIGPLTAADLRPI